MNKYSTKLVNFLNKNFENEYKLYDYENNETIRLISDTFKSILNSSNEQMQLSESKHIKKMHFDTDLCLVYVLLMSLYNDKILQKYHQCTFDPNNMTSFLEWFEKNQIEIDLKGMVSRCVAKKYKLFFDIFFRPTKERQFLHELLYDNRFISFDILHYVETTDILYHHYVGNNSDIYVYYPINEKGEKNDVDIELISKIISFYRKLFNKRDLHVKIIIFMGKQKKFITNKIISPTNVNSGSTIRETKIMIWREEEILKVLIHELIHYFGLDFYVHDEVYKKVNNIFKKTFTIDGIDRVNESYTETLAITLHSIVYSQLKNISFNKVLSYEILFSNYQIAKILDLMNFKNCYEIKINKITQMTSVCSYYIVKCMFLMCYSKILEHWKKNGFYVSDDNIDEYVSIYKNIVNMSSLNIQSIDNMIEFINKNKNNSFVYKTMRMSLFQM